VVFFDGGREAYLLKKSQVGVAETCKVGIGVAYSVKATDHTTMVVLKDVKPQQKTPWVGFPRGLCSHRTN
jgi:hypothetical protein